MTNDIKACAPQSINAPPETRPADPSLKQTDTENLKWRIYLQIAAHDSNGAKGDTDQAAYKRLHLFSIKRCHRFGPIGMHGKTADE